ncbi:type-F conjugative transfer system pilin assembly protein TrbC [Escherichia coli]|uniref:type-F conjugative transfer system pilin assembly protein TrbC n=1 Tax=Escherichia coli TaxID=562 RepID=UPI001BFFC645|nr:type-F conjugative transfer system pilin assembly protein TrbC [Escherichia coli]
MNRKIFALFALTAGMHLAVHASENVNTTENRQFLKQQENLSRQLREKPDHQLKAWAEKQVLENPLQRSDNHFLDELVRKQQASQDGKPRQGALYFVSFSIPEEGLKRMLSETRHYGIRSVPALVVFCSQGHDIIRGNLRVRQALEKVAATGDCRQVAHDLLAGKGDSGK